MFTPPTPPPPIDNHERTARIAALCDSLKANGHSALVLSATTSLRYFTGLSWYPSERFLGAIIHDDGRITYVAPRFELDKIKLILKLDGDILTWEEHEDPYALIMSAIHGSGAIALDDGMALFMYHRLVSASGGRALVDGGRHINYLRARKSPQEIALMTYAKAITLDVHRRAYQSLEDGMKASEVASFINAAHLCLAGAKSTFCIVSFGEDTSLPHGGEGDRVLRDGDVVLIDTGTQVDGYNSDITRTYVFGKPASDVARIWELEKKAQAAAFSAAQIGVPCEAVDAAARGVLIEAGLGPDYRLPGLPHRTGHGIGLDVHEAPNLVRGDTTPLATGMCFSNEPMIVLPGRFGIRLEDHFYMTDAGPKWFTQPQHSLESPFEGVPIWG